MKGKEPTAGLVNPFGDKVGRKETFLLNGSGFPISIDIGKRIHFAVFEGEMMLSVRHSAGVEPHIYKVAFTAHVLSARRKQYDFVGIRPVQIKAEIILHRHIVGHETFERIFGHQAGGHRLLNFGFQLSHRTNADSLLAIVGTPDRQWDSPISGAAQVPILQILEPVTKATGTGAFGAPTDFSIKGNQTVFGRRSADKPTVERIIQHRFVGSPTMRIGVLVFLNFKSFSFEFELKGNALIYAQVFVEVWDDTSQTLLLKGKLLLLFGVA